MWALLTACIFSAPAYARNVAAISPEPAGFLSWLVWRFAFVRGRLAAAQHIIAMWIGSGSSEPQAAGLIGPVQRDLDPVLQIPGRQLHRLAAIENGVDDGRGKAGERKVPGHVAHVGAIGLGQRRHCGMNITDQLGHPASGPCEGSDQDLVGLRLGLAALHQDQLGFDAPAAHPSARANPAPSV